MVGLSGIQMAFKNWTIWHQTPFWTFEYPMSLIFWSHCKVVTFIRAKFELFEREAMKLGWGTWGRFKVINLTHLQILSAGMVHMVRARTLICSRGMCTYHKVINKLTFQKHVPTYLLALHDFQTLFNSPFERSTKIVELRKSKKDSNKNSSAIKNQSNFMNLQFQKMYLFLSGSFLYDMIERATTPLVKYRDKKIGKLLLNIIFIL